MSESVLATLRVGFMPLLDCATLVVAQQKGFAQAEGLDLRLVRETSWANIRDRVTVGHFDAAHMLGPMVVAASLGIGLPEVSLLAPVALGRGGNAITVSGKLWSLMSAHGAVLDAEPAAQAAALARAIAARARNADAPLTLAMVFPFSSHHYLLRSWLSGAGVDPDRDVRIVVLPPPLLVDALRSGQIDGFCVGEPWGSLVVAAGLGCIVATTRDIQPDAPEKVLGMRADWANRHPAQVAALVRSVDASARWCDEAANHAELATLLAEPRFVGVPATTLRGALDGRLCTAQGSPAKDCPGFIAFWRDGATRPTREQARWILAQMQACGQVPEAWALRTQAEQAFRPDLYQCAVDRDPFPA